MSEADDTAQALETGRKLFAGPVDFLLGVAGLNQLPEADRPEVAFAGRSNVGKSSLVNALTGRKTLARTSGEPGKTRELNYFDLGEGRLYLVDLPGFGYAKVSRAQAERWMELTRTYLRGRSNLRRVFLLVDSRRGLMAADTDVMDMLDITAVNYQIVMTKTDKIKPSALNGLVDTIETRLKTRPAAHPVVRPTSAIKGAGIAQLRADIAALAT
ncbi:MAG: YihA family ribosome biogenesis GTP-binding protein [Alphaproteobacteria bacterium]|jgi:GTP-binding protein|nr:YihA family ribosome biogenesis GTP-binding protein [Alphaproteobacteria bacterium]